MFFAELTLTLIYATYAAAEALRRLRAQYPGLQRAGDLGSASLWLVEILSPLR
jgi:hypothetical protein